MTQRQTKINRRAIAVLISDIHFNLKTIDVASAALQQAYDYANDSDLPLVIAGDLHDTKANIRGECINAINKIFEPYMVKTYILVGNHDLINEKASENALGFIKNATLVPSTNSDHETFSMVPYYSNADAFVKAVKEDCHGRIIICHQGITGTNSGEYFQDKSAVNAKDLPKDIRIISGHYHTRQTIELPNGGTWDYIGNPYTLNYGEAKDPEKGFQVLYSDGSLEFVPTNLRKHITVELTPNKHNMIAENLTYGPEDLLRVKLNGSRENLTYWTKTKVAEALKITIPFKLELIPDKVETAAPTKSLSQAEVLDQLIESATGIEKETKKRLKNLWKSYVN